jgi:hypothetical protein
VIYQTTCLDVAKGGEHGSYSSHHHPKHNGLRLQADQYPGLVSNLVHSHSVVTFQLHSRNKSPVPTISLSVELNFVSNTVSCMRELHLLDIDFTHRKTIVSDICIHFSYRVTTKGACCVSSRANTGLFVTCAMLMGHPVVSWPATWAT